MSSNCTDAEDTFYSALSDPTYYDVDDRDHRYGGGRTQSPRTIVAQLQTQEEEALRDDCLLADKLEEIACKLRGGISRECTPKCATPPMPLKEILCAVERRLKEKVKENPCACLSPDPERMAQVYFEDEEINMAADEDLRGTVGDILQRRRERKAAQCIPKPPLQCNPPIRQMHAYPLQACLSPDPVRMAQVYFEDEEINMAADEDLRGTVGDILQRRRERKAAQCIPKPPLQCSPPIRQMHAYPMQGEDCPAEVECELLGVTDVETSNYAESVRKRATPYRRPRSPRVSKLPDIHFSPDLFHGIDWKQMPEKSVAELIEDQRRMQEDDIIDQFARQLVQEKNLCSPSAYTSTPKGRSRVRRWSPDRLAAISRRFGIPTTARAGPCTEQRQRDRVEDYDISF